MISNSDNIGQHHVNSPFKVGKDLLVSCKTTKKCTIKQIVAGRTKKWLDEAE
jgi:hypothetical protein